MKILERFLKSRRGLSTFAFVLMFLGVAVLGVGFFFSVKMLSKTTSEVSASAIYSIISREDVQQILAVAAKEVAKQVAKDGRNATESDFITVANNLLAEYVHKKGLNVSMTLIKIEDVSEDKIGTTEGIAVETSYGRYILVIEKK